MDSQVRVVDVGLDEAPMQLCFTIIVCPPECFRAFLAIVETAAPLVTCHIRQETLPFLTPLQSNEAHEERLTIWSGG